VAGGLHPGRPHLRRRHPPGPRLPAGTTVKEVHADKVYELTVPGKADAGLTRGGEETARRDRKGVPRAGLHGNRNYGGRLHRCGSCWSSFGANVPLRGLASIIAILAILLLTVLFAYLDLWPTNPRLPWAALHVEISVAGLPRAVRRAAGDVDVDAVTSTNPLRYMIFHPGGRWSCTRKSADFARKCFDTAQIRWRRSASPTCFRHWILGFGAGRT